MAHRNFIYIYSSFLGFVDLQGTCYESSTIASGYGAYIAQPLLRKAVEGKEDSLTEQEATALLNDCLRVLYYRDARSLNRVITILLMLGSNRNC